MKTYQNEIGLDDDVSVMFEGINIMHCTITAIKFTRTEIRFDVRTPLGHNLYDLNASLVKGTGKNIDTTEII